MVKPLNSFARQLRGFHSQIWGRIQELAGARSKEGMSELLSLVSIFGELQVGVVGLHARLENVPPDELERLLKSSLFQEQAKPADKGAKTSTPKSKGRAGRPSSLEEKNIILAFAKEEGLQHSPKELHRIIARPHSEGGRGLSEVTPRSVRMILRHAFGEKPPASSSSEPSTTPKAETSEKTDGVSADEWQ